MSTEPELSWEQTKTLVDTLVFKQTNKYLSDIEIDVLRGAWEGKSYEEIADQLFRSVSYINKDVGYRLRKKLSDALGEEVTKKSFRQALQREWQNQSAISSLSATTANVASIPSYGSGETVFNFPEGPVALNSPFYVERPPIEFDCYKEIVKPGALIRIRAPRQMGKTSLINRILAYAAQQNYQIVRINLRKAEKTVFENLNRFLRWFCMNVSRQLSREPKLDEYWDEEIGSKVSCTGYFQSYILEQLQANLVISLDEIDVVFNYSDIAEDFLALIREWHEEAMIQESWQKLRLIISHSTEVYISLNIHQSPFNVGLPLKLPFFNQQQVEALAQIHGLAGSFEEAQALIAMLGGHPYLIRLALYHLVRQDVSLQQLLQFAPTHAGVYSDHLRRCLGNLKQQPELAAIVKQVMTAQSPILIEPVTAYQLDSMGLVRFNGNQAIPSCELYRQYFSTNLT
jgi:DNA-binding CsgD family transcriptional regulator